MMDSSEDCDFPVNLVHPSLCIDTFLSDQLYRNLQLASDIKAKTDQLPVLRLPESALVQVSSIPT
jgi:hypothetical protein